MRRLTWIAMAGLLLVLFGCRGVQRQLGGWLRLESAGVVVRQQPLELRWPRFAETASVVVLSSADTLATGTVAGRTALSGELLASRLDLKWRLDPYGWPGEARVGLRLFAIPGQDGLLGRGSVVLWAGDPFLDVELPAFVDGPSPDIPAPERARWVLHYAFQ